MSHSIERRTSDLSRATAQVGFLWVALAAGCATSTGVRGPEPSDPFPAAEPAGESSGTPVSGRAGTATGVPKAALGPQLERSEVPTIQAPTGSEESEVAAVPEASPDWLDGRLSTRYWGRWTKDDGDHKFFATLSVDVGDPEVHDVTAHFMGRAVWNADRSDGTFSGIADTYDDDVVGYLYDAYVDFHSFARLRVGRQTIWDTPETVMFDGLSVESDELGDAEIQFGGYGGKSVWIYRGTSNSDWLAGAYASARPWEGGRVRLDYMHAEDGTVLGGQENDLFGAGLWQTIAKKVQFEGEYTALESQSRDGRARLAYYDPESDFQLQGSYYQLYTAQLDLAQQFDPFYNALHALYPYYQFGLMSSKGFGEHFRAQVGADLRRVQDEVDVGQFNRDYERYFANVGIDEAPWSGFTATLIMDLWYSDGTDTQTWGLDLGQQISDPLLASIGTYYSLFKYDIFTNSERDDVRTYYARLLHETTEDLDLEATYELEDSDGQTYHGLRLGGVWRF